MTILKIAITVVWELRKVVVAQPVVAVVSEHWKEVAEIVVKVVVRKVVLVDVIILPNRPVQIVVLLVAMVVKIPPGHPVVQAVAIVVIWLVRKPVRQLVVMHVFQPVWGDARLLVFWDVKPDAGVTIDTDFSMYPLSFKK